MLVVLLLLVCLVITGCTADEDPAESAPDPTPPAASPTPSATTSPTATETSPAPTAEPTRPPNPVSLPAYFDKGYNGGALRLREIARTDAYTQSFATYRSGDLTISGQLFRPHGRGPFPALVYAHGYIDPDIYVNGQGLRREQDYMARQGYVVLHVDYRGHASSSAAPRAELALRLGYTEDVVNAVLALKKQRYVDPERVGLLGRSMGGGVVYNVLVAQPGLVRAAVAFAPVSSNTVDNFDRWIRPDPSRAGLARQIIDRFGSPEARPGFWSRTSPRTYFDRITEPLLVHHGTSDDSCPIRWTHRTVGALRAAGKHVRLYVYDGEEHAFGPQWPLSMQRTTDFLERNL